MSFSNISFVLHRPQLSENIGACARAIKNFNFKKLIIVNPKPLFPNDKILATSVGAKEIIKNSKVYEDMESAAKKFDYIVATTSRFRNINLKHIRLNNLNEIDFSKKIGFLFGSEASGLSNNEISYANCTMQIPANPKFKSLNLSHSVIIIAQVVASLINLKNAKILYNGMNRYLFRLNARSIKLNELKLLLININFKNIFLILNLEIFSSSFDIYGYRFGNFWLYG